MATKKVWRPTVSKTRATSRGKGYVERSVDTKALRTRFLIVCEGEKTERNYFRRFRVPGKIIDVKGIGFNTISLVKEALKLRAKAEYDRVWCVFDRDSFPAQNFNAALDLAASKGIEVAYSNEAFELWYLLHFDYHQAGISRKAYIDILERKLGYTYEKNSEFMYDELESRMPIAIRNAQRLLENYVPRHPERDNPSTTIHLLVEELLKSSS